MSSQRERQRERERNQRQLTTPSIGSHSHSNNSLFGEPIKQEHDDETSKRIKSTLGDFDSVQLLLINDPKPLLGISTREIRIKGHKAKIQQILSEMKHTLEPITALDDFSDETNAKYSNNNNINVNNSEHNVNDLQRNIQTNDRNSRRNTNTNNNSIDLDIDRLSGDEKSFNQNKVPNPKKRKSSKSDAENGTKSNGTKRTKSTSSSNSSESDSNSSSISSSSSESSDEEEEEEEKESDNISLKQEEVSSVRQDTPKTATAPQPEIAIWDLETFMDKKTTTTTTTSTTISSNTSTTIKTNSYDNIADVIDRVAKGELGESMSSSSASPPQTPKKRRKSTHSSDSIRNEHSKQNLSSKQSQHKTSKHNQQNKNSSSNQDFMFEQHIKEMKFDPQKASLTPKSLIVSIKLMLLKRIPGQTYSNINNSGSSNRSNSSSISLEAIPSLGNDDNNSSFFKSKTTLNSKLDKRSVKTENVNKTRDTNSKTNNSSVSKTLSKQQLQQDNDSRNAEHIPSRDNATQSTSSFIKQEPHSPLQALPPLTSSVALPPIPPPPTMASNITSALMRTPPEISPTVGQPDDFLSSAKRLKHAADRETDRTVQACKYLDSILYFILTGNAMEQRSAANETEKVCTMYKETLNLIRQITNKFSKSRSSHSADIPTTDHKLTTLSYRCQSLLYLKLSRLKSKEIRDNNKTIQLQTPQESNCSENTTIQTSLLNVLQRQLFLLQQYHTAHDLWQQADHLIEKHPSCKAFFVALDTECGSLSLNSTFDHLVTYVRTGLQILK